MYIDISIIVKHLRYFYHDRIYLNILFIVYFLRRIFINRKFPRFENEFEKYKMILYCFFDQTIFYEIMIIFMIKKKKIFKKCCR